MTNSAGFDFLLLREGPQWKHGFPTLFVSTVLFFISSKFLFSLLTIAPNYVTVEDYSCSSLTDFSLKDRYDAGNLWLVIFVLRNFPKKKKKDKYKPSMAIIFCWESPKLLKFKPLYGLRNSKPVCLHLFPFLFSFEINL